MTVTVCGVNGGSPGPDLWIDREDMVALLSREIGLEPERLAHATAIRPQRPSDGLRDNRDRSAVNFRGREPAPAHDGNAEHVEVRGRDVLVGQRSLARADDSKPVGNLRKERRPDAGVSRNRRVVRDRLEHRGSLGFIDDVDQYRVSGADPRVELRRCQRASQKDRGADQQQRRRKHLHADQDVARATGFRVLNQFATQRPYWFDPRGLQCRHQREEGGGGDGRNHEEQRNAPISGRHAEVDVAQINGHGAHRPGNRAFESKARDDIPSGGCREREQDVLGQQLPDNAAPRCADRQSNADLALACDPTGEQQVGDIGATNKQDQPEREEQRGEQPDSLQGLRHGATVGQQLNAHGPLGGAGRLVGIPRRELGASALHRDARFQAADDLDAGLVLAAANVGQEIGDSRQRRPEVRRADLETTEPFRHHADNLERRAADEHRPSQHVWIAIEVALPSRVAQHEHGIAARAIVIGRAQRSTHDRVHGHGVKETARHQVDRHHPAVNPQIELVHRRIGACEDVRFLAQRFETRAGERRGIIIGLLRPFDGVHLVDVGHRVSPEDQDVQDGEEHRDDAQSDRNGRDDGQRGQRRASESAQRELKVADGVVDERGAALVATFVGGNGRRPELRLCPRPGVFRGRP